MQIKQSRMLEKILSQGAFNIERDNSRFPMESLFLMMLSEERCNATQILKRLLKDWEIYQLKIRIERETGKASASPAERTDTNGFFERLAVRLEEVASRSHCPDGIIRTAHLLLLIAEDKSLMSARAMELYHITPGLIGDWMGRLNFDEEQNASAAAPPDRSLPPRATDDPDDEEEDYTPARRSRRTASMLDKYGIDLTQAAARGEIDPVIGRDKEIERVIQILGRRKKNNPILIGEAGVGKSAIVEGLALKMVGGEAPLSLRDKRLFSLDITSLVAGTKYRGEFEERIKALLDELARNKQVVVFIDEIHTIVGAGSTQGSLDTANILKPALARGELQCIGATTLDEYRENIEKDSALERRFQKVMVEPTTKEQTLAILRNIRSHYERHHSVRYTDRALEACVELTDRYVTDRHFPDKAIDVLDEAGSKAHIFGTCEPEYIRSLERDLGEVSRQRKQAVAELVYEQAAAARVRELSLRHELSQSRHQWEESLRTNPVTVDTEHIEQVITSMTGIPVEKVSCSEQNRLRGMADHLDSVVIGQHEAVNKVCRAIQRSRAGLKSPDKPIGVFMFVGPTGVGKTHLAKELSHWMFDRRDSLVRIDMSEYSEKHNVSRLIGSPPGYVGYNEGGQLTETVRRQPYSVILFDEIEKAHPDVFNIMLQIFDDGQLTDGLGRKVDFRNTVIIMTSNVGSRALEQKGNIVGYHTVSQPRIRQTEDESGYRKSLQETFAPEFINRIDDIVIFNTLSLEEVTRIVDLELEGLNRRAAALGYTLRIDPEARERIARMGYDPKYGVRSLKRTILSQIEEPLAQMIVGGEIAGGDGVEIVLCDQHISLRKAG